MTNFLSISCVSGSADEIGLASLSGAWVSHFSRVLQRLGEKPEQGLSFKQHQEYKALVNARWYFDAIGSRTPNRMNRFFRPVLKHSSR